MRTADLKKRISAVCPDSITGDKGYKLTDVRNGEITLDAFIAQLNDEGHGSFIAGGRRNGRSSGAPGNAAIRGHHTVSLDQGIPPSLRQRAFGVRLKAACSVTPCAPLSLHWDGAYGGASAFIGDELRQTAAIVLLAGYEHSSQSLCGRNYEYYRRSVLSGKMDCGGSQGNPI